VVKVGTKVRGHSVGSTAIPDIGTARFLEVGQMGLIIPVVKKVLG